MSIKALLLTLAVFIILGVGYFIFIYHPQELRIDCMQIARFERHQESGLMRDGVNIDSDVLKIGHHGSNSSTVQGFIDKVTPATAVIQVGENRYGHPHQAVLSRLDGITLLRNDLNGGIVLYSYGDSF